jgi:hypothetical protein
MAREEAHVPSVYSGEGIPVSEFNAALDRYLTDGTGETDLFVRMSRKQQRVFQEIKKSFNRLNKRITIYGEGRD